MRGYRLPLAWALPAGLTLGAIIGLALFASSDADTQTLGWFGYTVALGAGVGVVTAVVAALGAAGAVALDSRRSADSRSLPALGPIALGAASGVALVALLVGVASSVAAGYWSALEFWFIGGVIDATIAAVAATTIAAITVRRPRGRVREAARR
ncbi:hypothetical protein D1781_00275 [Amnibacterium setariae]|uniref:Uncharacterized protein n=1 Tax=Amnibacterium setariae TaxID=2306585 RepID=A0A3A1U9B9_9MICO|nr:hypothetical protein D1781_00275 [Amnibacterium setariae]